MNTNWESIKEEIEQLYNYVDRNSFNLIVLQTMVKQLGIAIDNFLKELTERNEQNEIH